jgi:hypothetical protein
MSKYQRRGDLWHSVEKRNRDDDPEWKAYITLAQEVGLAPKSAGVGLSTQFNLGRYFGSICPYRRTDQREVYAVYGCPLAHSAGV